jgi:arylsulfatase
MSDPKDRRPNIILIITDQQRYDTIAALGFDHMRTPHLDRLVRGGTTFTRCYVTAPSCAPSRASLFTGLYPHTSGVMRNADRWEHSWVETLNAAGYHCANIGKMHTWPYDTPMGFHHRFVVENKDRFLEGKEFQDEWDQALAARGLVKQQRVLYRQRQDYTESLGAFLWELPADLHSDNFVGDAARRWIEDYEEDKPFFLEIGFPGPHPPYDPTPEIAREYLDKTLPLQPVHAAELEGQPAAFKALRQHNVEVDHDSIVHDLQPTEAQRHRQRAHYLANVGMIDEKIGEIFTALESRGQLENSVVIFTSDHGDCLTDHGHSQKWTMYEQVTRVPLIVWSPGRVLADQRVEGLCQLMDVGPTILELAGLIPPTHMAARSLSPALTTAGDWQPRDVVFSEQVRDNNLTSTEYMTMVRDNRWKLVHLFEETDGQLFDLAADPDETKNLWDDPRHESEKLRLLATLREWRIGTAIQCKDHGADHR